MPQNSTISNLPEDTSVSIADYVAIVTPGLGQTRKAKLSSILALATGTGGAPNYVGKYASLAALQSFLPVGADGNYAIVTASPNDEEYIWDSDHNAWVLTQNTPASTFALLGGNPTDNTALAAALASAGAVFATGFTVNLPTNNTGIPNGTVVNAGDAVAPFLKAAFSKASQPTVAVDTNGDSQPYNQININLSVSMGYTINTSGATLANLKLERSRDNATWTTLLSTATATSAYADNSLNSAINNNPIYYRLTVTDSAGGTNSATRAVTFVGYAAPSISFGVGNTTRERADVNTTITGSINQNSSNIALSSYQVQYQVNGAGSWTNIGSPVSISGASASISINHNDSSFYSSDSLTYRVQVVDAQQTSTSGTETVTFIYPYFYGNAATNTTSFNIYATGAKAIASGAGSLNIPFSSSSQYPWFAVEASIAPKTTWYVTALNNGGIGGSTNLFATGASVTVTGTNWTGTYLIYMANYATTLNTTTIS